MPLTPEIQQMLAELGQLAVRNSAGIVYTRVQAIRARKSDKATANELVDIINELVEEKSQLISIARGLEGQVVAEQISEGDLEFITEKLVPIVEKLIDLSDDDVKPDPEMVETMKSLLAKETLEILQLVGFNYKAAIGQPLTEIVERLILRLVPTADTSELMTKLNAEYQVEMLKIASDPEALARLQKLSGSEES